MDDQTLASNLRSTLNIIAIVLFSPMLILTTNTVRQKEYSMSQVLLEIVVYMFALPRAAISLMSTLRCWLLLSATSPKQ